MGAGRKTREEILQEEHDKFMQEVKDSGLPSHIIDYYGLPILPLNDDIEEEKEHNGE